MDARRAGPTRYAAVAVALAAAAATAACGSDAAAPPPANAAPPASHITTGVFLVPEIASNAVTYDPAKVPQNATATVTESVHGSQTVVTLNVTGLQPSTEYGVHATTEPCGTQPGSAGARYQNRPDPAGVPSTDPEYANTSNELWLDFTTTPAGTAYSTRTLGWTFRPGEARSLVFLDHLTSTGTHDAGDAGARLACLDVDF